MNRTTIVRMAVIAMMMVPVVEGQPASAQNERAVASAATIRTQPAAEAIAKAERAVENWTKKVDVMRARLVDEDGFLKLPGNVVDVLIFDREAGLAQLRQKYAPAFAEAGEEMPEDFFAPLEQSLDLLWREIDRLAPSYAAPEGDHAKMGERVGRSLRGIVPDAEIVRAVTTEKGSMGLGRSSQGLMVGRRSSGLVLYRVPNIRWVICREFTLERALAGAGTEEKDGEVSFGGVRFQVGE